MANQIRKVMPMGYSTKYELDFDVTFPKYTAKNKTKIIPDKYNEILFILSRFIFLFCDGIICLYDNLVKYNVGILY